MIRPILKWVGGKAKLLPDLLAAVPASYGRYYEPFAGGAALFFALAPARAVLADVEPALIDCYRAVAADVDAVLTELLDHRERHDKRHYMATRDAWNARETCAVAAAPLSPATATRPARASSTRRGTCPRSRAAAA